MNVTLKSKGVVVGYTVVYSSDEKEWLNEAKAKITDTVFDSVVVTKNDYSEEKNDYTAENNEYLTSIKDEIEFQAALKAESAAAIEEKRKAFMAKRKK